MCGIRLYRGPCRVQYGKNSSHLKNFTPTSQLMQLTIFRYDFRKPQDLSFLMVLSQKIFPSKNIEEKGFLLFFMSTPKKRFQVAANRTIFDPRRSAHGSSESFCSILSAAHVEKVLIFKIVGASPFRSQVIQNLVHQNSCF